MDLLLILWRFILAITVQQDQFSNRGYAAVSQVVFGRSQLWGQRREDKYRPSRIVCQSCENLDQQVELVVDKFRLVMEISNDFEIDGTMVMNVAEANLVLLEPIMNRDTVSIWKTHKANERNIETLISGTWIRAESGNHDAHPGTRSHLDRDYPDWRSQLESH
jgi:hypothetical protein